MASVLGVRGGLSVDHLVAVGAPAAYHQLGGPGLFGALGGRLVAGTTVRLAAGLPDAEPRFASLLASLGIDVAHCWAIPDVPRLWILNAPEGRRIVETAPLSAVEIEGVASSGDGGVPAASLGAAVERTTIAGEADGRGADGRSGGFDPSTAEKANGLDDYAFTAGLDGLLDSSPLTRPRVASGTVVGIDPHQLPLQRDGLDHLRQVVPPGAVVLPSRVQLGLLDPDPREAARLIASALGVAVVARLDREGIDVVGAEGAWSVRDPAVEVRETTGAGDSSAAAIVAALAQGADLVTAARFGASIARIALSDVGSAALVRAHPLSAPFDDIITTPL
ncbi:PfkB family carbohydrate kinase [Herbiconiux sp. P16]|uniref:PfkB family carbohydrate kinase n=1 Tax=Herbiconiux wuyangfengii TaxID=3342794 RepID=UPI0035B6BD24